VIGLEDAVFVPPSGGGGYGDPLWRPAELVAEDVRNGKVSIGAASALYGVLLDRNGASTTRPRENGVASFAACASERIRKPSARKLVRRRIAAISG